MKNPMMKCGHAANATSDGKPCCAICSPSNGWDVVDNNAIVEGREAKCGSCKNIKASSPNLAFFEHRPDKPLDSYYCGCRGWN